MKFFSVHHTNGEDFGVWHADSGSEAITEARKHAAYAFDDDVEKESLIAVEITVDEYIGYWDLKWKAKYDARRVAAQKGEQNEQPIS